MLVKVLNIKKASTSGRPQQFIFAVAVFALGIAGGIIGSSFQTGAASSTGTCLPISKGGTGCDVAATRNYLGLGNTTGPLPVANGGTGATTIAAARTNLGLGDSATRNILDSYPIGSIFITTVNTNPGTFLGGTWSAFGQGRTMLGIGSTAANTVTTYGNTAAGGINRTTAEERGGEVSNTLTLAQIPSHTHNITTTDTTNLPWPIQVASTNIDNNTGTSQNRFTIANGASPGPGTFVAAATGGGGAHNNIQPYITVYLWKRTN